MLAAENKINKQPDDQSFSGWIDDAGEELRLGQIHHGLHLPQLRFHASQKLDQGYIFFKEIIFFAHLAMINAPPSPSRHNNVSCLIWRPDIIANKNVRSLTFIYFGIYYAFRFFPFSSNFRWVALLGVLSLLCDNFFPATISPSNYCEYPYILASLWKKRYLDYDWLFQTKLFLLFINLGSYHVLYPIPE